MLIIPFVQLLLKGKSPFYTNQIESEDMLFTLAYQSPHRQRHIPRRHDQPPDQNKASDNPSQNEAQREQRDPAAQRAAARYDPETQPPDAERRPAEYPEP